MFKKGKAQVILTYECSKCKRDIIARVALVEFEHFADIKTEIVDTLNVEGHAIQGDTWICPDCKTLDNFDAIMEARKNDDR